MANPWDGVTYQNGAIEPGVGNGEIACATKKGTSEIYWKTDGGSGAWSGPAVIAGTVPSGSPKACRPVLRKDGSVAVTNGINWSRISSEYGKAGSWSDG